MGLNPSLGCSPQGHQAYPGAPTPAFKRSQQLRSLTKKLGLSAQYFLISISTLLACSGQARLRPTSGGACYYQARVTYHAYTQVTRTDRLEPVADLHHSDEWLHLAQV